MNTAVRNTVALRRADLARIHLLAKQLGLDRESYENVLYALARVTSAADLDTQGRLAVIKHLYSRLPADKRRPRPRQRPADSKAAMVAKIRALLINGPTRRDDAYADALAQKMFGVEKFSWCEPAQLHKLIAALAIDNRRHGKSAS